jgi:Transglycosylase SLT domain
MSLRTTSKNAVRTSSRATPAALRRPGIFLGVAAAGALMVGAVTGGEPVASAEPEPAASVSIADRLGISAAPSTASAQERLAPLQDLAASRSERKAEQAAAAKAQAAKDAAAREAERKAAEEAARKEAERKAAEEAARKEAERKAAAEEAARQEAARAEAAKPAPAASPSGSFQDYALGKLGGSAGQFSCLESLWGKESGWNPNAQNPTSSAYGIAQFLDSTWAGTGIAKTSDGYRQIDAGLIYINNRYGSPCAAWQHSQANNWY